MIFCPLFWMTFEFSHSLRVQPTRAKPRAAFGRGVTGTLAALLNALGWSEHAHDSMLPSGLLGRSQVGVADKLTLSLVEASQLSGLSRGHLRQAIEAKKLRARIIGRGWRVKREDLEAYVKKL